MGRSQKGWGTCAACGAVDKALYARDWCGKCRSASRPRWHPAPLPPVDWAAEIVLPRPARIPVCTGLADCGRPVAVGGPFARLCWRCRGLLAPGERAAIWDREAREYTDHAQAQRAPLLGKEMRYVG